MNSVPAAQLAANDKERSFGCMCILVLFLPFLLDTCVNRDPNLYVDEHYRLVAISPSQPKSLIYERPMPKQRWIADIDEVTELMLADRVITGKAQHAFDQGSPSVCYFIVDRLTDEQLFFKSEERWKEALAQTFSTHAGGLKPLNKNYAWFRGNSLYPYNLIYYSLALLWLGRVRHRRWQRSRNMKQGSEIEVSNEN